MDVLEIDAASNRGIDEIRDLREKIAYAPSMGKEKVYIIDEVHMLTREAFNALLKTLEEPPEHVRFILATTEPQKLPDTILSRCVQLTFSKATAEELVRSLKRVVTGEKLTLSDKSLNLIAKSADGSFRDAVKLLEQAVLENTLTPEDISRIVGVGNTKDFLNSLMHKKVKETLEKVEEQAKNGTDFVLFNAALIEHVHEQLLVHPEDREIRKLIACLVRSYSDTKKASIPQLPLELAVIEYCNTITSS
jgi:DNA polymerase-3 subunit gamma/tau